jgi:hypothetical protein
MTSPGTDGVKQPATSGGLAQVRLEADGRMAGDVLVSRRGDLVLMHFTVAHGHLPATTRRDLVEQAFRLPELHYSRQPVLVTLPLGDAELLQRLEEHLCGLQPRAAGATCLVEAITPS